MAQPARGDLLEAKKKTRGKMRNEPLCTAFSFPIQEWGAKEQQLWMLIISTSVQGGGSPRQKELREPPAASATDLALSTE